MTPPKPPGGAPRGALAIALLAGLAHTAAFAPLNLWWLQPLALAALLTEALADLDPAARDAILAAAPHLDTLLTTLRAHTRPERDPRTSGNPVAAAPPGTG